MRRKREEAKEPALRAERLSRNVPTTIDSKRIWDEGEGDEADMLGWAIDVEHLAKRRKLVEDEADAQNGEDSLLAKLKKRDEPAEEEDAEEEQDEDIDSMLEDKLDEDDENSQESESEAKPAKRASSPAVSTTSTNLEMSPEFLKTVSY